jgi:hypothetical protein
MDIREMFFMAVTQQDSMWAQKMRDMNHSLMRKQLPNRPENVEKTRAQLSAWLQAQRHL